MPVAATHTHTHTNTHTHTHVLIDACAHVYTQVVPAILERRLDCVLRRFNGNFTVLLTVLRHNDIRNVYVNTARKRLRMCLSQSRYVVISPKDDNTLST